MSFSKTLPTFEIAGRAIGHGQPPYIIAELSANHNGKLEKAIALLEAAASTGVDAIKIQTYTADTITIPHDSDQFRIKGGLWDGYLLHELYRQAETPFEWHSALFNRAHELGVTIFSTPFDESAVELLAGLNAPAYKIASFEAIDLQLIAAVAKKRRPVIISTGMANLAEIQDAVKTAREHGASGVCLLHCTSAYPAPFEDANLRTLPHLAQAFGVVSGLSDHTLGTAAAVASVALGGSVIEKHFTISRADGGPDSSFSLEPDEFKQLVDDCRAAWKALGDVQYDLVGSERGNLVFRRSLYAVKPIASGEKLTTTNVRSIRPGFGLSPKYLPEVLGRTAARDIAYGEPLVWSAIK